MIETATKAVDKGTKKIAHRAWLQRVISPLIICCMLSFMWWLNFIVQSI